MNNEKWDNVLIEWVNCLKLCKSINGIEELRNGEFFSNLQKVITKSRNAQLDILTFIFDLFNKHYPNYTFDNKKEIHLSDLPDPDLKALTSLLMHYTCIYDRKDVLTSPLCHSLSQSTQLIIRNFLEKLNKEVTNDTMNVTIKSCIDDASDHSTNNQWLSIETSSFKNSPLQELLKTPMSRFRRLQEKDRIIAKLKTELDAERFDKAELQEDLKRQIEKNNKIEQQIAQKNSEVLRLRGDVLALENRTPPHYQDMDSRELQKRLRAEISTLEQYIKQIENEQDEILKEKDAAKEQVRKLESQSRIWEEKFFETERNFELLKDHSKQQEDELVELKAHCAEITALLDEYRIKSNDSSLYDTFGSISETKMNETVSTCEDLACSVVEVQLRDAQKLNDELKMRIKEIEESEVQLKATMTKVEEEKTKEEERNEELLLKVRTLEQSEENLQKHLIELQNKLKESESLTQEKQEEISKLTIEIKDASTALSELSTDNKELQSKVASLESCHQDLQNRLTEALTHLENERKRSQDLENERNCAKSVSEKLQFELADLVLSNQKLTLQLDDLKGVNDELLEKLDDAETTRKLLETHLYDSRRSSDTMSAELGRLQLEYSALHCELNECRADFEKEKAELIVKLHDSSEKFDVLQKVNEELKSDISNLRNQLTEALERVEESRNHATQLEDAQVGLEKQLENVQGLTKTLEGELSQLRAEKKEISKLLDENRSNLEVVEKEKENLETKIQELEESQSTLSTRNDELSKEVDSLHTQVRNTGQSLEKKTKEAETLKKKIAHLESVLDEVQSFLEGYQKQAEEQRLENEKLTQTLHEKEEIFAENTRVFANQIDELNLVLHDTKNQLDHHQKEVQQLTDVRDRLEAQLREARAQTEATCADLHQMKIEKDEMSKEIQSMVERIRKIEEERDQIVSGFDETFAKCQMIGEEMIKEVDTLRRQLNDADETLKVTENELAELRVEKQALENELEDVREANDDLEREVGEFGLQTFSLKSALEDLGGSVETLSKENQELVEKLENVEKEKAELLQQNKDSQATLYKNAEQLEAVNTQLQSLEDCKNSLEVLLNEANNSIEQQKSQFLIIESQSQEKSEQLAKLEIKKSEIENQMQQLQTVHEDIQTKLSLAEEICDDQKREMVKLNEDFEATKTYCSDLEKEKDNLNSLLQNSLKKNEEFNAVVENLQRQLAEDRKTITDFKNAEEILQQKLLDLCSAVEDAEIDKQKAHEDLMNLKNQNQVLISKLEDYETKCSRLEEKVTEVINNLILNNEESEEVRNKLEDERVMLSTKLAVLEENLEIAEAKNLEILAQKSELEKEKIGYEEMMSKNTERVKKLMEEQEEIRRTLESEKKALTTNLLDLEARLTDSEEKKLLLEERVAELVVTNDKILAEKQKNEETSTTILKEKEELELLKTQDEKRIVDLENEIKELKNRNVTAIDLNFTVTEMVDKLHELVTDNTDVPSMTTLKSRYDDVHAKVNNLLQVKQRLSEELRQIEDDKRKLNKQIEALKVENEAICKAKAEVENTLKDERDKVESLRKELETGTKSVKTEKENILGVSTKPNKSREEDLKKENMMLKRKIVLAENAKNNLEKVLKELREDKKKGVPFTSPDALYKKLLQDYIQVKEENEKVLKERDAKIAELTKENEELKNVPMKPEDDKKLHNIREAYGNLMSVNSKLELEMVTLRKMMEERNNEVASLAHIKEAYERLLEENNKINTEVDTLKYKRTRDKEEFVRLLKKERESSDSREMRKIQEIRSDYEGKLEKMKDKMLQLYREEVNKKVKSLKDGQNDTANLMKTVATLRSELFEADQKIQTLEMEREILRSNRDVRTVQLKSTSSITSISTNPKRSTTLPRPSITKEFTISERTSIAGIPNLPMEDEEDLFNDKYLTELKEGRCILPEDRNARFSELAWRNSMVPPHLKSSYPAETQFISPTRFKDDDLKTGNVELEDSLCKLLPGEKPRKKDFGTTSYKKPGPPTPSKNGGRLSLQGNEVHPLKEHCEARTPKRSTPSRIKALFTGRGTLKDSESQSNGTPSRGRRLNIFRRPR